MNQMKQQFMQFCCSANHCRNAEDIYGWFVKDCIMIPVLYPEKQQPTNIISLYANTVADRLNGWWEIQSD
jgi:hypothetical protein